MFEVWQNSLQQIFIWAQDLTPSRLTNSTSTVKKNPRKCFVRIQTFLTFVLLQKVPVLFYRIFPLSLSRKINCALCSTWISVSLFVTFGTSSCVWSSQHVLLLTVWTPKHVEETIALCISSDASANHPRRAMRAAQVAMHTIPVALKTHVSLQVFRQDRSNCVTELFASNTSTESQEIIPAVSTDLLSTSPTQIDCVWRFPIVVSL